MTDFDFANPPIDFSELSDSEIGRQWEEQCHKVFYDEGWVRLGKIKACFARNYVRYYERIRDFQTQPDDIWVSSFPKCGTTWTQEMVYCIATDLDFEAAKTGLQKRFPYFELRANWSPNLTNIIADNVLKNNNNSSTEDENKSFFLNSFDLVDHLETPRFIKTHLHYSLLPTAMKNEQSPKMIYVTRNPKDACISLYHHFCLMDGYGGSLEDFVNCFVEDTVFCGPYWTHVREYWEIKDRPNVLFLKYEDMKKDLPSVIRQTANFLGVTLTDEKVERLTDHLSFESMRKNPAVNYEDIVCNMRNLHGSYHESKFMRKGKVDSWKDEMTPEMVEKLDAWVAKNKINGLYEK
ncbi:unnamed protein product [Orchesella dallaii]|uniref:Sulfotransferase domain-containing protein n=1 Tax=Orchesella dallaii TaxID=48710 RepID=A0ABP1RCA6_9HEXA